MAFDIANALGKGVDRTTTRTGVVFVAILFVLGSFNEIVGVGMTRWATEQPFWDDFGLPFGPATTTDVVAINPAVGSSLSLLASIAILVTTIAAIRAFVRPESDSVSGDLFSRRILWTGLNYVVGAIVFAVAVAFGLLFFLVPGFFLMVTLWFWSVFVAVEDENFVDAFAKSWALTRGSRLNLFVLGVVVVLVSAIFTTIFTFGGAFGGITGIVLSQATFAVTTTFSLATTAQAYVILAEDRVTGGSVDEQPTDGDALAQ